MKRYLFFLLVAAAHADDWSLITVPGAWEDQPGGAYAMHDGFAWYRCYVKVPEAWRGKRLLLSAAKIDDVDEVYFNGDQIGVNGGMPPLYGDPSTDIRRPAVIDPDQIRYGEFNLIAWRIYDKGAKGGILQGPVQLATIDQAIDLSGTWDFQRGDNLTWAQWPADPTSIAAKEELARFLVRHWNRPAGSGPLTTADKAGRERAMAIVAERFAGNPNDYATTEGKGPPLPPREALDRMEVAKDFALDLVLAEPEVRQPLFVDFDERGRMWVNQYIQYPKPAGLEVLTWDSHLRVVFDAMPPPPPYRRPEQAKFLGRDKISIHEDTDGDGVYDRHKTFLEGLSIATSTARGRGGIWVLNPPYLLFYPDANNDDIPDADPVVHLSGFGLEDTHSVANSLKWGPDGWLYGATGSTVTGRIRVERNPQAKPLRFFGQTAWRYHPKRQVFELFCEGGYNTFGIDFDDQGRMYTGTNGDTHVVHYVQGAFYRKGFGKHGPHTNPYAFDYFDTLPLENADKLRLVHQWLDYGGDAMPGYEGHLFGPNSLANRLSLIRKEPQGSSFSATELPSPVKTDHKWFRPVHAALGPDGAIYISDLYDARITHVDPRDNWDRDHGRIYRLRSQSAKPRAVLDLSKKTGSELVNLLSHRNRWFRQTALRLLADRQDQSVLPQLREQLAGPGQLALESLWAIHLLEGMDENTALVALGHANPHVRLWAIRLLGDRRDPLTAAAFSAMLDLAKSEAHPEVASQLASSLQRFPSPQALPLFEALISGDRFTSDPYIPTQLWWALESLTTRALPAVISQNPGWWDRGHFRSRLAQRLARRLASDPTESNLGHCATLIAAAPDAEALRELVTGMELGLQGIALGSIPKELSEAMSSRFASLGSDPKLLGFGVRLGLPGAAAAAREALGQATIPADKRAALLKQLAEAGGAENATAFMELMSKEKDEALLGTALNALRRFSDPGLAEAILRHYPAWQGSLRKTAQSVLCGRLTWARLLVGAAENGHISRESVGTDSLIVLRNHRDADLDQKVEKLWGKIRQPNEAKQKRMAEIREILKAGQGDSTSGKALFNATCASCHRLHGEGALIGPELTGYERDNLEFLLPAVVDPNLGLREEFELVTVTLRPKPGESDNAVLSGFVRELTESSLRIVDLAGNESTVAQRDVLTKENSPVSVMPEGLLDSLTPDQVRDLFAYLMSAKK